MKKESRQESIVRHLELAGYISVEEVASLYSVTTQTARRDIAELEHSGRLRRHHGGATLLKTVGTAAYWERRSENMPAKARIADEVASIIPENASVFIDTGTTCEAVASRLTRHISLRVVTYSLRAAAVLSDSPGTVVAVPGGVVRPVHGGVFREDTPDFIGRFKFDYCVVSVSGVDTDGDICDDDIEEAAVVCAAMKRAKTVILAVDGSKFGKRALVQIGTLWDIQILVTDASPNLELKEKLRKAGVDLRLV